MSPVSEPYFPLQGNTGSGNVSARREASAEPAQANGAASAASADEKASEAKPAATSSPGAQTSGLTKLDEEVAVQVQRLFIWLTVPVGV